MQNSLSSYIVSREHHLHPFSFEIDASQERLELNLRQKITALFIAVVVGIVTFPLFIVGGLALGYLTFTCLCAHMKIDAIAKRATVMQDSSAENNEEQDEFKSPQATAPATTTVILKKESTAPNLTKSVEEFKAIFAITSLEELDDYVGDLSSFRANTPVPVQLAKEESAVKHNVVTAFRHYAAMYIETMQKKESLKVDLNLYLKSAVPVSNDESVIDAFIMSREDVLKKGINPRTVGGCGDGHLFQLNAALETAKSKHPRIIQLMVDRELRLTQKNWTLATQLQQKVDQETLNDAQKHDNTAHARVLTKRMAAPKKCTIYVASPGSKVAKEYLLHEGQYAAIPGISDT